jgi:hypothetical protein
MDSLLLSSDGFPIGSFLLPAFQLRAGECVCLHLPETMTSSEVEQLIRILIGGKNVPGVRLFGRLLWAAPLRPRRHGLLGLFRPLRVADWLSRIAGASPTQAQSILQRLHPQERECYLEQLPGTPRMLLSVEAAWLAGAQGIVFATRGLDPLGCEAVYEAVSSHFSQGGAIHLSFPFLQNEQRLRHCFAGTTCLELKRSSESPRSVTTIPGRGEHA